MLFIEVSCMIARFLPTLLLTLSTPLLAASNPFEGSELYLDSNYAAHIEESIQRSPERASALEPLKSVGTAVWMDTISHIALAETALERAREQQNSSGKPVIVTTVVYNLPERDCAAKASNGELTAAANGMEIYKRQYIDRIAELFDKYSDLHIAAVIEPDSLPNLVTNMGVDKCAKAAPLYREGVEYALRKLQANHIALYLDIGHGGWLGWPNNRESAARVFKEVVDRAGGSGVIRGFATNVANYSPTYAPANDTHSAAYYDWNPAIDEMTFVRLMQENLKNEGFNDVHFLIDTGRNGNPYARKSWKNWCNIRDAGLGQRPQIAPAEGVDAFLWIKPPGESDGTADPAAPRFDASCVSEDSHLGSPEAGVWNHEHLLRMLDYADSSWH
ncbi:MAG: cellulose 1,4-beta-cellobiosidase [Proteobacteria bacterium]|nr:MAG: cellulose 1,4-beta-cellobiosidase [Pseudomonadota bacterium]